MKLLITTQTVDRDDLYLGFFHAWIAQLAPQFEAISVVCLKEGAHELPQNVRVYSLGKERGKASRLAYAWRFLKLTWRLRFDYDAVLVHMNQEYILIAGWLWTLFGKKIYLWRNHYAGSFATDVAAAFCTKVFCTSKFSYTAKYKKTLFMPVGIDTARYRSSPGVLRSPRSILFYARMSPSKHPDMLMEALGLLHGKGIECAADFYGTPLPQDKTYLESLKRRAHELGLTHVRFYPGQPPADGPAIFSAHEIFVNLGGSGMYDKMLFEAAACGDLVLAMSRDWALLVPPTLSFDEGDVEMLATRLERLLMLPPAEKESLRTRLAEVSATQSLHALGAALSAAISN